MLSFLITSCTLKDYSNNLNTDDNIKNEEAENESSGKVQALINLYIRSEPTIDSSNILGILDKYDTIDFIKRYDNEWYVVNFKGITAYISAKIKNSKILTTEENTDNNLTYSVYDFHINLFIIYLLIIILILFINFFKSI
jgi:uncharacterized protein YgiM (DUF1202 family)